MVWSSADKGVAMASVSLRTLRYRRAAEVASGCARRAAMIAGAAGAKDLTFVFDIQRSLCDRALYVGAVDGFHQACRRKVPAWPDPP